MLLLLETAYLLLRSTLHPALYPQRLKSMASHLWLGLANGSKLVRVQRAARKTSSDIYFFEFFSLSPSVGQCLCFPPENFCLHQLVPPWLWSVLVNIGSCFFPIAPQICGMAMAFEVASHVYFTFPVFITIKLFPHLWNVFFIIPCSLSPFSCAVCFPWDFDWDASLFQLCLSLDPPPEPAPSLYILLQTSWNITIYTAPNSLPLEAHILLLNQNVPSPSTFLKFTFK